MSLSFGIEDASLSQIITRAFPDHLLRRITTFLSSKDALSLASTCRQNYQKLSLSAVLVTEQAIPVPLESRSQATASTVAMKRLTRIYVPLAHKTQSITVKVTLDLNDDDDDDALRNRQHAETPRLHIIAHHPNHTPPLMSEKGATVTSWYPGTATVSFVPSPSEIYMLWSSRARNRPSAKLNVQVHSVIFDSPSKLVAGTYHKLYQKMGSLQNGGLLYLRLLQSLANTLHVSLRFQQTPENGWIQILNELHIPYDLPHIQVLGEVVQWVEEDLSKFEEHPKEDDQKQQMEEEAPQQQQQHWDDPDDPIQARRRQRRRLMFRDRAHFRMQNNDNNNNNNDDNHAIDLRDAAMMLFEEGNDDHDLPPPDVQRDRQQMMPQLHPPAAAHVHDGAGRRRRRLPNFQPLLPAAPMLQHIDEQPQHQHLEAVLANPPLEQQAFLNAMEIDEVLEALL